MQVAEGRPVQTLPADHQDVTASQQDQQFPLDFVDGQIVERTGPRHLARPFAAVGSGIEDPVEQADLLGKEQPTVKAFGIVYKPAYPSRDT